MYNIEAGVFTDLERCTPSSVAGISADIPPNDIFGVGRPPCADDLLVDVVSFFDHSHWRAASMSKTCVATRAMFDGLLKVIFVYNVEEAALNHSRWDSSRLLHCPSGHSGTCKKMGARCRDHILLTSACTWIHQEVFVQNDLNNTFFRASHLTRQGFHSSRHGFWLLVLHSVFSPHIVRGCRSRPLARLCFAFLHVKKGHRHRPRPTMSIRFRSGLFRQEPRTWVHRGEHGKFLRQHGVTDCCGLFFLVYSSSSSVWSRLPIIQVDHVWCGYASPPT